MRSNRRLTLRDEAKVERRLRDEVKKRGGIAVKFVSPGYRGWPDRLVLMPPGRVYFVELKAPGKKPNPQQIRRKQQLQALGFHAVVLDSVASVDAWIEEYIDA